MAKFSVFRDEYEDEDDRSSTEYPRRSPKRLRTSHHSRYEPSAPSQSMEDFEQQSDDEGVDAEEKETVDDFGVGTSRARSISVTLSDPDVLDCSICFEPLTIPVFQCHNGHIACSKCHSKLRNKCPSCSETIGYNRCRAIEKVLEAVQVSCCYEKYGCKTKVSYCDKLGHEEMCVYGPCSCPLTDCCYRGSSKSLSKHMIQKHPHAVMNFRFNSILTLYVEMGEDFVVLREEKEGVLFVIHVDEKMAIKCVESNPLRGKFKYDVTVRTSCSSLKFQSVTEPTTGRMSDTEPRHHVVVPDYFYDSEDTLAVDISIWSKNIPPADII